MRYVPKRGEHLGLNDDEIVPFDDQTANQSAVEVLGDQQLVLIARELIEKVKQNASIG